MNGVAGVGFEPHSRDPGPICQPALEESRTIHSSRPLAPERTQRVPGQTLQFHFRSAYYGKQDHPATRGFPAALGFSLGHQIERQTSWFAPFSGAAGPKWRRAGRWIRTAAGHFPCPPVSRFAPPAPVPGQSIPPSKATPAASTTSPQCDQNTRPTKTICSEKPG